MAPASRASASDLSYGDKYAASDEHGAAGRRIQRGRADQRRSEQLNLLSVSLRSLGELRCVRNRDFVSARQDVIRAVARRQNMHAAPAESDIM